MREAPHRQTGANGVEGKQEGYPLALVALASKQPDLSYRAHRIIQLDKSLSPINLLHFLSKPSYNQVGVDRPPTPSPLNLLAVLSKTQEGTISLLIRLSSHPCIRHQVVTFISTNRSVDSLVSTSSQKNIQLIKINFYKFKLTLSYKFPDHNVKSLLFPTTYSWPIPPSYLRGSQKCSATVSKTSQNPVQHRASLVVGGQCFLTYNPHVSPNSGLYVTALA